MAPKRKRDETGDLHPNTNRAEAEMLAAAVEALKNLVRDYTEEAIETIDMPLLFHEEPSQEPPEGSFWSDDLTMPNPHSQESSATDDESQEDPIAHLHRRFDALYQQELKWRPDVSEKIKSRGATDDKLGEFNASGKEVREIESNPDVKITKEWVNETVSKCRSVIASLLADVLAIVTNKGKRGEDEDGVKSLDSFVARMEWTRKYKCCGFIYSVWVALKAGARIEGTTGGNQDAMKSKKTEEGESSSRDTVNEERPTDEVSTGRNREAMKSKKTGGESSSRDAVKGKRPIDEVLDRLVLAIQLVSYLGNNRLILIYRVLCSNDQRRLHEFVKECLGELELIGTLILQLNAPT